MHDIQQRYDNYDHIAVGPTGVYMLETKNLQGIVEIRVAPRLGGEFGAVTLAVPSGYAAYARTGPPKR